MNDRPTGRKGSSKAWVIAIHFESFWIKTRYHSVRYPKILMIETFDWISRAQDQNQTNEPEKSIHRPQNFIFIMNDSIFLRSVFMLINQIITIIIAIGIQNCYKITCFTYDRNGTGKKWSKFLKRSIHTDKKNEKKTVFDVFYGKWSIYTFEKASMLKVSQKIVYSLSTRLRYIFSAISPFITLFWISS